MKAATTFSIRNLCMAVALVFATTMMFGQTKPDEKQKVKTGWTFGALPAISYNSDLGFQYGALVNLYHYGDGSTYPKYRHNLYAEWSRFTKGSGVNRFFYDSEYLIPGIRFTADLNYFTEQALDFYGFNGFDAVYNPEWEDSEASSYRSRMFYRHERNMFRLMVDFQGGIIGKKLRWVGGFGILNIQVAPVDIARLNKGKKPEDQLPDIPGLYQKYIDWGIIGENEKDGGWNNNLKLGLVYDTRDVESHPMKGIWSEIVLFTAPKFLGNGDFGYSKISATHRQYFTVIKDKLSFAYRLNYQGTISGTVPFYMQPYMINSFSLSSNTDGLGGSKTIRGMLRNRVVGDAFAFGNAELRWKAFRTLIFGQNFYLGLNAFVDGGQVLKKVDFTIPEINTNKVNKSPETDVVEDYFDPKKDSESLHLSAGAGIRLVLNENFIVAVDYGQPFDKRDGKRGLYIGLNYLF